VGKAERQEGKWEGVGKRGEERVGWETEHRGEMCEVRADERVGRMTRREAYIRGERMGGRQEAGARKRAGEV